MAPRPETANRTSTFIGNWLRGQRRDTWVIASKVTGERATRGAGRVTTRTTIGRLQPLYPFPEYQRTRPPHALTPTASYGVTPEPQRMKAVRPPKACSVHCRLQLYVLQRLYTQSPARMCPLRPRPPLVAGRSTGLDWIPANRTDPPGPREHPRLDGPSIVAACEAELRRLRTDHIDLLQLHWPDRCGGVHLRRGR